MNPRMRTALGPALVTLGVLLLVVGVVLADADWDPLALARVGSRFAEGDPGGEEGYDGQFNYFIARDPRPAQVEPFLDVPAYRYQRVLLPVLARLAALGREAWIPWSLIGIGLLSHVLGTGVVAHLLHGWGAHPWYALSYGLWAGLLLAVRLDLPEPLAYGLVAAAVWAGVRRRPLLAALGFALAAFAKEVTLIFALAWVIARAREGRWLEAIRSAAIIILPFTIFQIWLWFVFGQPGIGSGGANATPFVAFPLQGLLLIGAYSSVLLLGMLVVFGPTVIFPALWGIWLGARRWMRGAADFPSIALFLNGLVILFLPFSTFREPGGLLRFASGLVLAVLLFAGSSRHRRALKLSMFWLVLNVFLLK